MTESNEREPMTFTCQQLAACEGWCGPGKCPMWCGLGRCQPVFARAAAPQAEQAAINPWTGREPEPEPAAGPQPAEPAAAPQAQPSTAEYLRRTAIPKPDPDFHKRADEPPQAQPAIAPNCPYDRGPMGAYFSGWRCAACGSQVEIIADLRALARSPEPAPPVVMQGAVQANNRQVDVLQNALHPEPAPISDERITLRIVLAEWDRLGADTQKMAVVGFKFAAAVRALLAEKGKP